MEQNGNHLTTSLKRYTDLSPPCADNALKATETSSSNSCCASWTDLLPQPVLAAAYQLSR